MVNSVRVGSLLSSLCIFWQYLASSLHLRYLTFCCWFSCFLDKLPICSCTSSICSHLIKMSTKIQIRFQANGSSLCLHSSYSTDFGGCKPTQRDLGMHCSHLQTQFLWKDHPVALRDLPAHIHASLLHGITCLPWVTPSFSYARVVSTCWILHENPMDRSSVLNSIFCSLLSFHEYKTPAQRGESAGRDQHYPYLMERESEFIDGKTMLEGQVQ